MRAVTAVALSSLAVVATGKCSLQADTDVVVYAATEWGGVGEYSDKWTRAFFAWWQTANADLDVVFITDPAELSAYYTDGCALADGQRYPELKLYVQPGGSADNQTASLGIGGRDNILDFAASTNGHYMGTCAGWYYAAGTWWWFNEFYPEAWQPHFWPTVEGPISPIAVYPDYAPTVLSNGLTMVYYGGPATGLNLTGNGLPNGATVLAAYTDKAIPADIPAVVNYQGRYVKALFNSPHPEAQAGVGLSCAPPFPAGCITSAQQLANWQFLAGNINGLLGTEWVVPAEL